MTDDDLRDELYRLELALARRTGDEIPGGLLSCIPDDFLEFGQSGRTWGRASIESLLTAAPDPAAASLELEAFEVARLAETVALVTYRAAGANRSSIWVRRDGRWLLRLHQGTPVEDARMG